MISIKLLAYPGAPGSLFRSGKEKLKKYFPEIEFQYYSPDTDILVFLSGGSESEAIEFIRPEKFYLLVAFDENNSWASATEVKALLDQRNIPCLLADLHEQDDRTLIDLFIRTKDRLQKLQGQTLGQLGEVSEWLVASTINPKLLKSKFGIRLKKISWEDVLDFMSLEPGLDFLEKYNAGSEPGVENASKVNEALHAIIQQEELDAITVECFSLVKKNSVTACLSLSHLNDLGVPAGCEGDLTSITGMMFVKALIGKIPWMANIIKVWNDCARFAHCTAATNLLEGFKIETHYETGLGTAIAGRFLAKDVTVFRLNNTLNKAFIAEGVIISTHLRPHACRTQIEVGITKKATDSLKNNPLGNHHLIIPGFHKKILEMACMAYGMEVI